LISQIGQQNRVTRLKLKPILCKLVSIALVQAAAWRKMHISAPILLGIFFTATEAWRVFLTDTFAVRISFFRKTVGSRFLLNFSQSISNSILRWRLFYDHTILES
jgi:hypothetical protein